VPAFVIDVRHGRRNRNVDVAGEDERVAEKKGGMMNKEIKLSSKVRGGVGIASPASRAGGYRPDLIVTR
jgi:uncharacterized membrane-anchored protein